jgi:hypothetical protein
MKMISERLFIIYLCSLLVLSAARLPTIMERSGWGCGAGLAWLPIAS